MPDDIVSPSGTSTVDPSPQGVLVIREHKEELLKADRQRREKIIVQVSSEFESLPAANRNILFGMSLNPSVQLTKPISVEITHEGETVIASWKEIEEYGCGRNYSEALDDFGKNVIQLFISLSAGENVLGEDMRSVLSVLKKHMKFRAAR